MGWSTLPLKGTSYATENPEDMFSACVIIFKGGKPPKQILHNTHCSGESGYGLSIGPNGYNTECLTKGFDGKKLRLRYEISQIISQELLKVGFVLFLALK